MKRVRTDRRHSGNLVLGVAAAALLALAPHTALAGKFKVLHSFCSQGDGCNPLGGLTADASGNFFGTTAEGGPSNTGAPFELRRNPDTGRLKYKVISF